MENPMENSHARSVSQVCGLTSFWVFGNLALKNPQRSHVVLSNYVLKFFCLGFSIIKTYKNIFSHLICNNFQKNHEKPWTTVKNHEKPILFCIKFSSHRCHMSPASQCAQEIDGSTGSPSHQISGAIQTRSCTWVQRPEATMLWGSAKKIIKHWYTMLQLFQLYQPSVVIS